MNRQTFPVGQMQCNCSILTCPTTNLAIVIDPGSDFEEIKRRLGSARVKCILITHAHFDHVLAARELQESTGADVYLHRADRWLYRIMPIQYKMFDIKGKRPPKIACYLSDNDEVVAGEIRLSVMHTPGHSPGSCCYHCQEHDTLFSGDTIFRGTVGDWKYPGGSLKQLVDSIRSRVMPLPSQTIVVPGHGSETTIGEELASNPYLQPGYFEHLLEEDAKKPGKASIMLSMLGGIFR
ncbi:MAG TPA: MBL fold metallo-hydrolase [Oculatellaceae cyanobacterium]